MRRHKLVSFVLPACAMIFFYAGSAPAHEADQPGPHTHKQLPVVVTKIDGGIVFVSPKSPKYELQHRAISVKKAERLGLHEIKVGDELTFMVDEGNVLVDAHKTGSPGAGHRLVDGKLTYADPFWGVVKVSTPEGVNSFAVDTLAGSKLSVLQEGTPVRLELDEDNMVIDIHRTH